MATKPTIDFFIKYANELKEPILEIGSLIDPSYTQYSPRQLHGDAIKDYTGIDIFDGVGVDYVINLTKKEDISKLGGRKFKTIHCHYVFEHVTDIFTMAKQLEELLDIDGVLLFSVPFAWRIHRIPIDMWRFTPQSIDYIFPNIEFIQDKCAYSTRRDGIYSPINQHIEFNLSSGLDKRNFFLRNAIKLLRRLKLDETFFSNRALLPESNLMMYGIRRMQPKYTFVDEKYINS